MVRPGIKSSLPKRVLRGASRDPLHSNPSPWVPLPLELEYFVNYSLFKCKLRKIYPSLLIYGVPTYIELKSGLVSFEMMLSTKSARALNFPNFYHSPFLVAIKFAIYSSAYGSPPWPLCCSRFYMLVKEVCFTGYVLKRTGQMHALVVTQWWMATWF
jgi:hypothetical protein